MSNLGDRILRLRGDYRRDNNLDLNGAVLGDATGLIPDQNIPGNVWVRVPTSNGLSAPRSVRAPAKYFAMKAGDPVQLEWHNGRLRIAEPDTDALLATGGDPVAASQQQFSGSTPQSNLETLRLITRGGMVVSLKGWNAIANRLYYPTSYPDIDLTSPVDYRPSAGQMCYAGIFVLADFSGVEIVSSTPRDVSDLLLGRADVNELLSLATPTSTATWAVKLIGGQTVITQDDIDAPLPGGTRDLRQAINNTPSLSDGQARYILMREEQPSGTHAGTAVNSTWTARVLNTLVTDQTGAVSLSSNRFTLPAGTYRIRASAPMLRVDHHRIKLYNFSDSADVLLGTSEWSNSSGLYTQSRSIIEGRFTIASSKTFEIRYQCNAGGSNSYELGAAASFGTEVYTVVELEQE